MGSRVLCEFNLEEEVLQLEAADRNRGEQADLAEGF